MRMFKLDRIASLLILIGALNWGLIGLSDLNLVTYLLGGVAYAPRTVYLLVGAAALYRFYQRLSKKLV